MNEQTRLSLGKQLRNSRLLKELTMEDIAKKLSTSKQNIDRYEKGNYKKPDLDLLAKLAQLLEIDLQNFGLKTVIFDKMTFTVVDNGNGEKMFKGETPVEVEIEKANLLADFWKNKYLEEKSKNESFDKR